MLLKLIEKLKELSKLADELTPIDLKARECTSISLGEYQEDVEEGDVAYLLKEIAEDGKHLTLESIAILTQAKEIIKKRVEDKEKEIDIFKEKRIELMSEMEEMRHEIAKLFIELSSEDKKKLTYLTLRLTRMEKEEETEIKSILDELGVEKIECSGSLRFIIGSKAMYSTFIEKLLQKDLLELFLKYQQPVKFDIYSFDIKMFPIYEKIKGES